MALRLAQVDIANALGISQSAYSRIETGERRDPDQAEKIAQFFGGAIDERHILYPHRFPDYLGPK